VPFVLVFCLMAHSLIGIIFIIITLDSGGPRRVEVLRGPFTMATSSRLSRLGCMLLGQHVRPLSFV